MNLLSFSLADKIVDQLPDTMRSQCDMWCDRSGFEISDPSQFKLTVGLRNDTFGIDRLLVKKDTATLTTQRIVNIVVAAIKAVAQYEKSTPDITLRPDISTKELEQGFMAVTNLDSVATNHPDHLIATV